MKPTTWGWHRALREHATHSGRGKRQWLPSPGRGAKKTIKINKHSRTDLLESERINSQGHENLENNVIT